MASDSGVLASKEDELVLLTLVFFGTSAVGPFLALRYALHRAEARGKGGVRDAARDSEARQQRRRNHHR
jgi:hypothetical protein